MTFPKKYKLLDTNVFEKENYKLVPIRYEDRLDIMKWRNEQMYHLRQTEKLTKEQQDYYFKNTIAHLFEQEQPNQLLFSYLKDNKCIGYGGLVHINWVDKNAEVSFIMNTELEKKEFELHWSNYLDLLDLVAFQKLQLHKIYVYAFDLRSYLYKAIENKGFEKEAILKEHCFFNGKYIDIVIHEKRR